MQQKANDVERDFFVEMSSRAARYGLKPGFASAKFKEKFEQWPPRAWQLQVDRAFADNPVWQAKVEYKRKEREHYEAWERDVMPIALERKAAWLEKRKTESKRIGKETIEGDVGSIVGVHQSGKRARPIHAFALGSDVTLCGQLVHGWTTERTPFKTSTEYGCKKCKKIFAKRDQLTMGMMR
jgi:hypothetical protein